MEGLAGPEPFGRDSKAKKFYDDVAPFGRPVLGVDFAQCKTR
jgi:hypothetical protein